MSIVTASLRSATVVLLVSGAAQLAAQVPVLENPQRSIFAAFPEADSYRVIKHDVDAAARKRIEALLPFRVHFDELGAHSLYVAQRGRRPIGMVYVQHEESAFGLAAVEWAFTFDLRVSGFRFQRVRSKHRASLERSEFVRLLKGRDRHDLAARLGDEGELLQPAKGVEADAQQLASAVVRSGVKSLAVLEAVWAAEIDKLRDLEVGLQSFPQALRIHRTWPAASQTNAPTNGDEAADPRAPKLILLLRACGRQSRTIGHVAAVRMSGGDRRFDVRWTIDAKGVVTRADIAATAPRAMRAACNDVEGQNTADLAARGGDVGEAMKRVRCSSRDPRPGDLRRRRPVPACRVGEARRCALP